MKLQFNNFLIIDNAGNLEYYNDDDATETIDLSEDEVFHLTLSRVYEEDGSIYLDYRGIHHFIKRINPNTICDIGLRINSDPGFYCREMILDYLDDIDIEAILKHDYPDIDYKHKLTEQIVDQIIDHVDKNYKTASFSISKSHDKVSQQDF